MGKTSRKIPFIGLLSDHFSSAWKLLSETTVFLSRTGEFYHYESQLREWRLTLQSSQSDAEAVKRIRADLTALRKHLRLQGYDLSLGRQNLVFDGFRNDASLGEGFRRAVLFITRDNLYYIAGEENHIALASYLERRIETNAIVLKTPVLGKHYLWYCRRGPDLILSGSDTEGKEAYERLKAAGEANSLFFLSRLKSLR